MLPVPSIISLIQPPQQVGAEEDRPDAIGRLLEPDGFLPQDMAHVHPAVMSADLGGPPVVVLPLEVIKPALLFVQRGRGGSSGFCRQGAVHPLVAAVLFRVRRLVQFRGDVHLDAPGAECRQPAQGAGRTGEPLSVR